MRKSGWAAATGLGSLVLLLAACGGSSGSTAASGGGSAAGAASSQASAAASGGSSGQAATSAPASASHKATSGSTPTSPSSSAHKTPRPRATSGGAPLPPQGTTFMIILHTKLGYVLGQAHGSQVVYTYGKDKKGGPPQCTGTCAAQFPPVTGMPRAGAADHFPGTFGVVKGSGGVSQITYNGMPLYLYKDAKAFTTPGQGMDGLWHVVPMSASYIG